VLVILGRGDGGTVGENHLGRKGDGCAYELGAGGRAGGLARLDAKDDHTPIGSGRGTVGEDHLGKGGKMLV
jgi:hypothetical protein